jgi:hypothetical protein
MIFLSLSAWSRLAKAKHENLGLLGLPKPNHSNPPSPSHPLTFRVGILLHNGLIGYHRVTSPTLVATVPIPLSRFGSRQVPVGSWGNFCSNLSNGGFRPRSTSHLEILMEPLLLQRAQPLSQAPIKYPWTPPLSSITTWSIYGESSLVNL